MLTTDEIDLAKEMLSMLRPMEVATRELCGQKYVTGSKVIPLIILPYKKKTESINIKSNRFNIKAGHVRKVIH